MLNFDIVPAEMTVAEREAWLSECSEEIAKAYDDDNITYANKLDMIYQIVKNMNNEKKNESFQYRVKHSILLETVQQEGNPEIDLIEVDENINSLKDELKDCDIEINATVTLDGENKIVDFPPIVVDIAFKLEYLDEKQHIILTYTPSSIPTELDIDSIPAKDYKTTFIENGLIVTFKSISNLADELGGLPFNETIEWPFEMDFKSAAVEKKFNKNKTLTAKIISLLGPDQLINKVSGYRSTHSSGSNKATRANKAAEQLRTTIRSRGPVKTRNQILKELLEGIPEVTNITEYDVPGNGRYYKRFRLTFRGGIMDVFNGGVNFMVSDKVAGGFGNKRQFYTDMEDRTASIEDTRNKMIAYVKDRIHNIQNPPSRNPLGNRERTETSPRFDINDVYNDFVKTANEIIAGTSNTPISALERKYDQLMDSERFLSDEQTRTIMELATQLNI